MERKNDMIALVAISALVVLLSVGGIVWTVVSGLIFSGLDGIMLLSICLVMGGVFTLELFSTSRKAGLLGAPKMKPAVAAVSPTAAGVPSAPASSDSFTSGAHPAIAPKPAAVPAAPKPPAGKPAVTPLPPAEASVQQGPATKSSVVTAPASPVAVQPAAAPAAPAAPKPTAPTPAPGELVTPSTPPEDSK